MKKAILKNTKWVTSWLGMMLLVGWFGMGCQTPSNKGTFSATGNSGNESGGPTNVVNGSTNGVNIPAPTSEPGNEVFGSGGDIFAIGDLVRVTFSGTVDNIQPHEERIKDDGTITLPLIGAIKAAGQKPGELQKAIKNAYVPDYYKRLTITVSSDRRVFYVGGQVRQPGRQEYLGKTTVTKAIQSAGDFTDFADRRSVFLTRGDGTKFTVNCLKAAKDPALDLAVFPGDKIEVPLRGIF